MRKIIWISVVIIGIMVQVCHATLYHNLSLLSYRNSGRYTSRDSVGYVKQHCKYLEPENQTSIDHSWASTDHFEYLYLTTGNKTVPPPSGMRSAVPLGGLATGTIELRGDGRLTAWTIENQSPAGGAKLSVQNDAFFAVRTLSPTKIVAKAIRTHPPNGIPGVDALVYHGSPPTSKLDIEDSSLPVEVTLYGYSTLKVNDLNTSHRPAIAFSLNLHNPQAVPITTSFMFNLPISIEQDTSRAGRGAVLSSSNSSDFLSCFYLCHADSRCVSWNFYSGNCTLQSQAGLNSYLYGSYSGIKGTWSVDTQSNCMTLNRIGVGPMYGNLSLCATGGDSVSFFTANNTQSIFNTFNQTQPTSTCTSCPYGAASVSKTLSPGENSTLSVVLSWFFPGRNYLDQSLGNYYVHLYNDSKDVGLSMVENLDNVVEHILALHTPFFNSSLPEWMQDILIGSLHHTRSAMWFEDGRWRQWEAFDCVNMDSIHNDGERHIPYIMFFPNSTVSKMFGWAKYQKSDGMLNEQLACGCTGKLDHNFEHGCGRTMSDVSSMFIVYLLEMYRWGGDLEVVKQLWPHAKRAAEWQLSVSQATGLPQHLVTTYDILDLAAYNESTYSSVFHLLAMRAATELAVVVGNHTFANICTVAFERGQKALDTLLWNTKEYWNAYTGGDAVMADCLYAQVLAYSLGLGTLTSSSDKILQHLATESKTNESPYGLSIMTGRDGHAIDHTIWLMAPADHATLLIWLGSNYSSALSVPFKLYSHLLSVLNDQWNTPGVLHGASSKDSPMTIKEKRITDDVALDGQPYITSHYGYYMTIWHTVLAISGQAANIPEGSLTFNPVLPPGYRLPVLLPGVLGVLESVVDARGSSLFSLYLTVGSLQLSHLAVGGSVYPGDAHVYAGGPPLKWS